MIHIKNHDALLESTNPNTGDGDEAIDDRVNELLKTEKFNPSIICNLCEAIGELTIYDQEIIDTYIKTGNYHAFGRHIFIASYEYFEKFAIEQAVKEYNDGLIGDDRDD